MKLGFFYMLFKQRIFFFPPKGLKKGPGGGNTGFGYKNFQKMGGAPQRLCERWFSKLGPREFFFL